MLNESHDDLRFLRSDSLALFELRGKSAEHGPLPYNAQLQAYLKSTLMDPLLRVSFENSQRWRMLAPMPGEDVSDLLLIHRPHSRKHPRGVFPDQLKQQLIEAKLLITELTLPNNVGGPKLDQVQSVLLERSQPSILIRYGWSAEQRQQRLLPFFTEVEASSNDGSIVDVSVGRNIQELQRDTRVAILNYAIAGDFGRPTGKSLHMLIT